MQTRMMMMTEYQIQLMHFQMMLLSLPTLMEMALEIMLIQMMMMMGRQMKTMLFLLMTQKLQILMQMVPVIMQTLTMIMMEYQTLMMRFLLTQKMERQQIKFQNLLPVMIIFLEEQPKQNSHMILIAMQEEMIHYQIQDPLLMTEYYLKIFQTIMQFSFQEILIMKK